MGLHAMSADNLDRGENHPTTVPTDQPRWWMPVVALAAVAAVLVSGYLAAVTLGWVQVVACATGSCTEWVLKSHWSRWFGVPVGALSVPLYATMTAGLILARGVVVGPARRLGWMLLIVTATAAAGAAAWFMWLMVFHLSKSCGLCITVHALGMAAAYFIALYAPVGGDRRRHLLSPADALRAASVGVLLLAVLIGPQIWKASTSPPDPVLVRPAAAAPERSPASPPVAVAAKPIMACGAEDAATQPAGTAALMPRSGDRSSP
ncbi:MAG: vitamin K epoxide reductase family protein [Phycisphaeraceae bacterium]|nr:vitamin K epoxide reductase family protein [Phycisphaeraceae bacterium]